MVSSSLPLSAAFQLVENEPGQITIRDGETTNILTYQYGDKLAPGVDPKYKRSSYIHPLYSLDSEVLTDDFPADHHHHHGISWVWPVVKTRDQSTQTWHPAQPALRQYFVSFAKREASDESAVLTVRNDWKLNETEIVASETVTLRVQPIIKNARLIDVEIELEAIGGPLTLQGTPTDNKGYGGFGLRAAPNFKGATLTTDTGPSENDIVNEQRVWADISTTNSGITITVPPDHPNAPLSWMIRNSYAGIINPCWPGLQPTTLEPGQPVTLKYQMKINRGNHASKY